MSSQLPEDLVTIQDNLLPSGIPILPGVDLAARYLLADSGHAAGGDWFDALVLADGRVALVVGDVVGHGVRGSVAMSGLKAVLEESLHDDGDVAAALQRLDRRARRVDEARAATVVVAVVDPASGRIEYATAGHPPPLLISAEGEATYLPTSGAGPLGCGASFATVEAHLEPGDLLLLYSDGLVERPGRTIGQNTLDLSQAAVDAYLGPEVEDDLTDRTVERVCAGVLGRLVGETGHADDVSVMTLQRTSMVQPLHLELPAAAGTQRLVRGALGSWLAALGVTSIDEMALQHAVGELVANSVEHAYPVTSEVDAAFTVALSATLQPSGHIEIEVSDRGHWVAPRPNTGRGRGLAMASGFVDEFRVSRTPAGTTACLRHRPTRAAQFLTATAGRTPTVGAPAVMEDRGDGALLLSGILDSGTADELRHRLDLASYGGTVQLVVDLSEVTLLGSAVVQVLCEHQWRTDHDHRAGVTLVAPVGSPAQHVLDLVRLAHQPTR